MQVCNLKRQLFNFVWLHFICGKCCLCCTVFPFLSTLSWNSNFDTKVANSESSHFQTGVLIFFTDRALNSVYLDAMHSRIKKNKVLRSCSNALWPEQVVCWRPADYFGTEYTVDSVYSVRRGRENQGWAVKNLSCNKLDWMSKIKTNRRDNHGQKNKRKSSTLRDKQSILIALDTNIAIRLPGQWSAMGLNWRDLINISHFVCYSN